MDESPQLVIRLLVASHRRREQPSHHRIVGIAALQRRAQATLQPVEELDLDVAELHAHPVIVSTEVAAHICSFLRDRRPRPWVRAAAAAHDARWMVACSP